MRRLIYTTLQDVSGQLGALGSDVDRLGGDIFQVAQLYASCISSTLSQAKASEVMPHAPDACRQSRAWETELQGFRPRVRRKQQTLRATAMRRT